MAVASVNWIPALSKPIFAEPGTFGFMSRRSLFGRGIGGGKVIELNISGPELEPILGVALRAAGKVSQIMPRSQGHQFRPRPGLELGAPEVRLVPNRIRLADAGVDARALASSVDAYNDGLRVDEITVGGQRINLLLKGPTGSTGTRTQDIGTYPGCHGLRRHPARIRPRRCGDYRRSDGNQAQGAESGQ